MPALVYIKTSAHNIVINNLHTSYFSNLYTCVNIIHFHGYDKMAFVWKQLFIFTLSCRAIYEFIIYTKLYHVLKNGW